MKSNTEKKRVRLHLTNVNSLGASILLSSLLPALEANDTVFVEKIELPDRGLLTMYKPLNNYTQTSIYKRLLPNVLSRVIECLFSQWIFKEKSPVLVLGDLPLRKISKQVVFLQQSFLVKRIKFEWKLHYLKFNFSRVLFALNLKYVDKFIVQTDLMKKKLNSTYPQTCGKVHVIQQPMPKWLFNSKVKRSGRVLETKYINFFYPASNYNHKNHCLLSKINFKCNIPIQKLILTIDPDTNPASHLPWIQCTGILDQKEMIHAYSETDCLLFLSKEESYGLPLVEAMFIGLPIVCPDLPYAHELCGNEALYFDPDSASSLIQSIHSMKHQLDKGWWPNWCRQLENIPKSWESIANQILEFMKNN